MAGMTHPKRLIEVDLPIKRISAHARREKSIRHGHLSTLHIWWARRPLASCRAAICAALWPDPADEHCPPAFREAAKAAMLDWARNRLDLASAESYPRFLAIQKDAGRLDDAIELRHALLDFIADFANWDNSKVKEYLDASRALTQAAHEALGGAPGSRPLVVDPFAGGGSIPLEALRVGADAFASDLNPIPVLLNKVVLEYIPRYGQRLADAVRQWGAWIKQQAERELAPFYPKDPDGAIPIAYLWARTIRCEGPGCGAEVPLVRGLWLSKKAGRMTALRLIPNRAQRRVDFEIVTHAQTAEVGPGTVARGSATCPCCGFTTPVASVRRQLKEKRGGADEARLLAVVTTRPGRSGRFYRLPTEADLAAVAAARAELARRQAAHTGALPLTPEEPTPQGGGSGAGRAFSQRNYGMDRFSDLFTARQLLALTTLARLVVEAGRQVRSREEAGFAEAVQTGLALALSRQADYLTSLTIWADTGEFIAHTFGRQALPIVWDWPECAPFRNGSGNWDGAVEWVSLVLEANAVSSQQGHAERCSATTHALPDDSAQAFITDPPYYDAVPYADLSDFFYVWLKRALPGFGTEALTPKAEECIVDEAKGKDRAWFERTMRQAMAEGRRILAPEGVGVVVFAHKSTAGWEAQLQAMCEAGWAVTGSWPIDTERPGRLRSQDSAALASSIHIVVRPREAPDGSLRATEVGDWRDVLAELPHRIHEWMPRLAEEGVVGADAIFACLGPALEIFSRYSRVEKASGEVVSLREYLEQVWAAVAKEALAQVFKDADTAGFEPDARLTAMWLWTLNAGAANGEESPDEEEEADEEEETKGKSAKAKGGFVLEYDAARKIAQGLGAHLEDMTHVIEISGESARLLPVSERTQYLFGKEQADAPTGARKKKAAQMDLFGELTKVSPDDTAWREQTVKKIGETTLDRVHQAMILFAAGRGEALKRFLVDDGAGRDQRFWRLAQALSALYPASTSEKRWVDGVLARKKGLGL
jgi:putative DNA methylase